MAWAKALVVAVNILIPITQNPPQAESDSRQVEDVVVVGHLGATTATYSASYINAVGAAPTGRKLARWRDSLCVSVVNIKAQTAHAIVDHVSSVAMTYGLRPGGPRCRPNVMIFMTRNGDETATALVRSRPNFFLVGASGAVRGASALRAFQTSGKPIRWWHVSIPVNPETGLAAVRLPGELPRTPSGDLTRPSDFGTGTTILGSRLLDQTADELRQVIIVVEGAAVE